MIRQATPSNYLSHHGNDVNSLICEDGSFLPRAAERTLFLIDFQREKGNIDCAQL